MPFIKLSTNKTISSQNNEKIKTQLGKVITTIHKSESYLMIETEGDKSMYFQGSDEPTAYVSVSLYGGSDSDSLNKLTQEITDIVSDELKIAKNRIYVAYFPTNSWGYNGYNF